MYSILVLHGPNLNLLGKREPEIYGQITLADLNQQIFTLAQTLRLAVRIEQSNHEGALIDFLQNAVSWAQGVVLNAAGLTHTSVAIRDTIRAIELPVIEVHLSNIFARETFRQQSLLAPVCRGSISGFGVLSYRLALMAFAEILFEGGS